MKGECGGECDPVDGAHWEMSQGVVDRDGDDAEKQVPLEDSGEAEASRSVVRPYLPTFAERRQHESTHCPFQELVYTLCTRIGGRESPQGGEGGFRSGRSATICFELLLVVFVFV